MYRLERRLLVQPGILNQPKEFSEETHCDTTAKNLIRLFAGENPKCIEEKFFPICHTDVALLPEVISKNTFSWLDHNFYEQGKSSVFFLRPVQKVDDSVLKIEVHWYEGEKKDITASS